MTLAPKKRLSSVTLAVVVLAVAAIAVFGAWSLATRSQPMDFYLETDTPEERRELLATVQARAAGVGLGEQEGEVLRIVAAIENFVLEKGHYPKTIRDLGMEENFIESGYRLVGSRAQWRLYGPSQEVLARGD
ncbi:MAG: hypothetical protein PWP23_1062 [Candidatus Sumerlaeota bacterium]|nr:hypothetical protein [Candidatus Sumerlaeota bacterium]